MATEAVFGSIHTKGNRWVWEELHAGYVVQRALEIEIRGDEGRRQPRVNGRQLEGLVLPQLGVRFSGNVSVSMCFHVTLGPVKNRD